jgi:hypothetical protein
LAARTPRAYRPRKRRSSQERSAFGQSFRAYRPWALRPTRRLAQLAPACEEELWCSRPVSALAIQPAKSAIVKVFGCRPFIDHCCPRRQGRRSKISKEGNRVSEGRRCRCDLWGFESRWRLLSSGRNDYQRRFRRIERSEGVFSGGNGIIFFAAAVFARGTRSIIGRAPSARRQKRAGLPRGG